MKVYSVYLHDWEDSQMRRKENISLLWCQSVRLCSEHWSNVCPGALGEVTQRAPACTGGSSGEGP